jgi:hypothetical protein
MEWHKIGGWAQDHPYATGGIILGIGLLLLWYLGYFSSSGGSSGQQGQSSLAGAYYAAEAQQAVVAGQIQTTTLQEAGATNRASIAALAAVDLGKQKENVSEAGFISDQTIARTNADAASYQLDSNNKSALDLAKVADTASSNYEIYHTIIPQELAQSGTFTFFGGGQQIYSAPVFGTATPISLQQQGYTLAQANKLLGIA